MLLLSVIGSSLDSFVIGLNFRLNNICLKRKQFILIFLYSFGCLFILHFILALFNISIVWKWLTPIIYIVLGILALISKDDGNSLVKGNILFLVLCHSYDGFIVSLTFLNQYAYPYLCFIFALVGMIFTFLGYKKGINIKHNSLISSILFFMLAFFSIF